MNKQKKETLFRIPTWIVLWLIISIIIVLWDSGFLFTRPDSFPGGRLAWIWVPYAKYITVDITYADLHNDFLIAQQIMNLLEISIGIIALYLNYKRKIDLAILLAFSTLLLTGAKTILIFVIEAVSGFKHVGHNTIHDLILLYILPNSLWLIFPFAGVIVLGRYLVVPEKPLMRLL